MNFLENLEAKYPVLGTVVGVLWGHKVKVSMLVIAAVVLLVVF